MEKLLKSKELREYLGICPKSLTNYINEGMPHITLGNKYMYSLPEVLEWLKQRSGKIPAKTK